MNREKRRPDRALIPFIVTLPADLIRQVRQRCVDEDASLSVIVETAMITFLDVGVHDADEDLLKVESRFKDIEQSEDTAGNIMKTTQTFFDSSDVARRGFFESMRR